MEICLPVGLPVSVAVSLDAGAAGSLVGAGSVVGSVVGSDAPVSAEAGSVVDDRAGLEALIDAARLRTLRFGERFPVAPPGFC